MPASVGSTSTFTQVTTEVESAAQTAKTGRSPMWRPRSLEVSQRQRPDWQIFTIATVPGRGAAVVACVMLLRLSQQQEAARPTLRSGESQDKIEKRIPRVESTGNCVRAHDLHRDEEDPVRSHPAATRTIQFAGDMPSGRNGQLATAGAARGAMDTRDPRCSSEVDVSATSKASWSSTD